METLKQAKQHLRDNWEKGTTCPCCGQMVKLYKRKLTSAMAYGLILLDREASGDWVHVENYFKNLSIPASIRGDFSKLRYWGLVSKKEGEREDGSNRLGYYKITAKGRDFVNGVVTVPSHVNLYNQKMLGFSEAHTSIRQALGKKFNYEELMSN